MTSIQAEPATGRSSRETEVGSLFVSNYPPFSFWSREAVADALEAFHRPPRPDTDLGLYLHIPFCRKRCKFCYFRVYTDKNFNEIGAYMDGLAREMERYSRMPAIEGRPPKFVYIGGGTPSYLSVEQLESLASRLQASISWEGAEEITFECEPGTLQESKVHAIKALGVTRLSLGVENFNDDILRENGRAHVSKEIWRVLPWIEDAGFDQLNIDLIAGMVGETWETWRETVATTVDLAPDSVTIYQMELPFNTRYAKGMMEGEDGDSFADWETKRAWQAYAFEELAKAGYETSSAYTMVRSDKECRFVYRNSVWQGCDLLGTGVASFGHVNGVHVQNVDSWGEYLGLLEQGQLPLGRAYVTSEGERLRRELLLQMKLGRLRAAPFESKFGVDIFDRFAPVFEELEDEGMVELAPGEVRLTEPGLLRVDSLLPRFYAPDHRNARYT